MKDLEYQKRLDFLKNYCLFNNNLNKLLKLIRIKDEDTYIHSINVAYYSLLLGQELNLSKKELGILANGGLLHDIGKIYIPNYI